MKFETLFQELSYSTEMIGALLAGIGQEEAQVKPGRHLHHLVAANPVSAPSHRSAGPDSQHRPKLVGICLYRPDALFSPKMRSPEQQQTHGSATTGARRRFGEL